MNPLEIRELFDYCPATGEFRYKDTGDIVVGTKFQGYLVKKIGTKTYRMHRLAYAWMTGSCIISIDCRLLISKF